MSREIDRRDFSVSRVTPIRETDLQARVSSSAGQLPGAHRIQITSFGARTGNPRVVTSEGALA